MIKVNPFQPHGMQSMMNQLQSHHTSLQQSSYHPNNRSNLDADRMSNNIPIHQHRKNQFNPYQDGEGTVAAIAGDDFVVIGGDTRVSKGYDVVSRTTSKLTFLTDKTVIAYSGMLADYNALVQNLKTKVEMYKYKIDREPTTQSLAHLVSKTLYGRRFFPYYTFNLVAGLNKEGRGVIYGYDAIGSYGDYACVAQGSAGHIVQPYLDSQVSGYNRLPTHMRNQSLSIESATKLMTNAFISASKRQMGTGDYLELVVISKAGIERKRMELHKD